jgi:hypothetical protein
VWLYDSTGEGGLLPSTAGVDIGGYDIPQYTELYFLGQSEPAYTQLNALSVEWHSGPYFSVGTPYYFILHHPSFGSLSGYSIIGAHYPVEYAAEDQHGPFTGVFRVYPQIMVPLSFSEFGLRPPIHELSQFGEDSSPLTTSISLDALIADDLTTAGLLTDLNLLAAGAISETTATLNIQYLEGHSLHGENEATLVFGLAVQRIYGYTLRILRTLRWTSNPYYHPALNPEQNQNTSRETTIRLFAVNGPVRLTLDLPGYLPSSIIVEQEPGYHRHITFVLVPDRNSPNPGISPDSMPDPGIQLFHFAQQNAVLGRAMPAPKLLPKTGDVNRDGFIDAADMIPTAIPLPNP